MLGAAAPGSTLGCKMLVQCRAGSGEAACSPRGCRVGGAQHGCLQPPSCHGACSGWGKVSSCILEGDSVVLDQICTPTSSFSHLFAV